MVSYFYLMASSEMHTITIIILRKRQRFSWFCFQCSNFYMLKGTVIRKYSAFAFIK